MEENNACTPTRVFPRIEDCCDARDRLRKESGRGGACISSVPNGLRSGKASWRFLPKVLARIRDWMPSGLPRWNARSDSRRWSSISKERLAAFQGTTPASRHQWQRRLYEQIQEAEAAVNGLCQAAGVSRAGYYRFLRRPQRKEADMDLRSRIQGIALQWPAYGYRRVQVELRKQGWEVNHKRVLRLMRADNLLCLRRRKFILTTDSKHGLRIYPNLAKDMVLTRINQLWLADITYIRLQVEFVYLAVLLDAFSRRCIGWALP